GKENAESTGGINKAGLDHIERASDRGECGRKRQRLHLGSPHRNAEAARGALAGLDGAQVKTEAAALDKTRDRKQKCQHDQEQIIVRKLAAEGEIPPPERDRRTL